MKELILQNSCCICSYKPILENIFLARQFFQTRPSLEVVSDGTFTPLVCQAFFFNFLSLKARKAQ